MGPHQTGKLDLIPQKFASVRVIRGRSLGIAPSDYLVASGAAVGAGAGTLFSVPAFFAGAFD
jgi:hypothetical protein